MDPYGNCLIMLPCETCRQHKEKTIYKLVDHVTGQESIEFNESIVFQVPCDQCQGIKACITSGHSLVDWHVDSFINSGSGQGQKRKAGPATPTSSRAVTSGLPSPKSSPAPQVRRLAREGSSGGEGGGEDFPELAELVNTGTIMEQIERIPVARKKLKRDFLEKMSRFEEVEAIKKAELKEVQGALARIQQLKELWRHGTQRHNRTLDETWQQLMQARIKEVEGEEQRLKDEKEELKKAAQMSITEGNDWLQNTELLEEEEGDSGDSAVGRAEGNSSIADPMDKEDETNHPNNGGDMGLGGGGDQGRGKESGAEEGSGGGGGLLNREEEAGREKGLIPFESAEGEHQGGGGDGEEDQQEGAGKGKPAGGNGEASEDTQSEVDVGEAPGLAANPNVMSTPSHAPPVPSATWASPWISSEWRKGGNEGSNGSGAGVMTSPAPMNKGEAPF